MRTGFSGVLFLAMMLSAGGCAMAVSTASKHDATPPDFSVDLTILVGGAVAEEPIAPPHLQQSRYIVMSDGRLHYGADPARGAEWLPPPIRTLDAQLMQELWHLAVDAGLTDDALASEPINFKKVTPASGQVAYLLGMTGQSKRWAVMRSSDFASPDPAMARLIHHLAEIAWAEQHVEALRPLPARYYFGPDPYARYRSIEAPITTPEQSPRK